MAVPTSFKTAYTHSILLFLFLSGTNHGLHLHVLLLLSLDEIICCSNRDFCTSFACCSVTRHYLQHVHPCMRYYSDTTCFHRQSSPHMFSKPLSIVHERLHHALSVCVVYASNHLSKSSLCSINDSPPPESANSMSMMSPYFRNSCQFWKMSILFVSFPVFKNLSE